MTTPADAWSGFSHDPRDPQVAGLRASDQDRDVARQLLADAYADGRLDRTEYDERSDRVATVRVLADISPLLLDLVAPPTSTSTSSLARASRTEIEQRAEREWQRRRREAVFSFLGPSLVTTAIWYATVGHDHPHWQNFWPAFVILFSFLNLIKTIARHHDIVEEEVKRLEKKRAKELKSRDEGSPGSA